jgi:hypothetical protein
LKLIPTLGFWSFLALEEELDLLLAATFCFITIG